MLQQSMSTLSTELKKPEETKESKETTKKVVNANKNSQASNTNRKQEEKILLPKKEEIKKELNQQEEITLTMRDYYGDHAAEVSAKRFLCSLFPLIWNVITDPFQILEFPVEWSEDNDINKRHVVKFNSQYILLTSRPYKNAKDNLYLIKWFCYFASKKDPNKVTHLTVISELPEEGFQELDTFLKTDNTLQYIYCTNMWADMLRIKFSIGHQQIGKFHDIIFHLARNRIRNQSNTLDLSHLYLPFIST